MSSNVFDIEEMRRGVSTPREEETPKEPKRARKREQLTGVELMAAQARLSGMVEKAFSTLEQAMEKADFNTAVKAAQILLDRSGFGPKSTMDVNTTHLDLTNLTRDQLADRAAKLVSTLRQKQVEAGTVIEGTATVQ